VLDFSCTRRLRLRPTAPAPTAHGRAEQQRLIQMTSGSISPLVKFISELTGKNFIVDEKVRGKSPLSPVEDLGRRSYCLPVRSASEGFTPFSRVDHQIVPSKEAKSNTIRTVNPNGAGGTDNTYRLIP